MALRALSSSAAPFHGAVPWGAAGPYELVRGEARFAVDPGHEANAAICDLARAEGAEAGEVTFAADVRILRPADPARGNGRVLVVVPNRGRIDALPLSTGVPAFFGGTDFERGDGFLLRHGWTLAWCGWQWDVPRGATLGLSAPQALDGGGPIEHWVCVDSVADVPRAQVLLADEGELYRFAPYAAADLDQPDATLTVRDSVNAPRRPIDRRRWRFARDAEGRPAADAAHIWLEGGFEPHRYYEVTYRTRTCPVVGTGLLAVRDFASFLRHGAGEAGARPAGELRRAFAFGASQSGRFLRHFLRLGLNRDEAGRQVFDGVLPHVAGGRVGGFNHRGGQPSHYGHSGPAAQPPFAIDGTPSLVARQRQLGAMPKVVSVNTSWEYWRGDASLSHLDPETGWDLPEGPDARSYLVAGVDHLGPSALKATMPVANPPQDLSPVLPLRAALANLVSWVCDGVEPPASRVPRRSDGTAVERASLLGRFAAIPGAHLFDPAHLPVTRRADLGPDAEAGIVRFPIEEGDAYPCYVPAVDGDGNEVAGIRLPEVAAPVATYTAWNPLPPSPSRPAALHDLVGSVFPFAPDRAARVASGDPRPSVEERYPGRDAYQARAAAVVADLVAGRLLLAEDAEAAVAAAVARYDAAVRPAPAAGAGSPAPPAGDGR